MSYDPKDFETLRTMLLNEYRNQVAGADITPGQEIYARCSVTAAALAMLAAGLQFVERQIFPDTADEANLEHHANLYGLTRKIATSATGTVTITGTNGTLVASGLVMVAEDGTEFTSTSGGTISSGELVVNVQAEIGAAGNKFADDELTIQSPPGGVDPTATVITTSGGTDLESVGALCARVLARMRAGNAGGRASDYEQWALAIDGVVAADCLATRRGAGTCSIAVYTEGAGGVRTPADSTVRAAVLAAVDALRPVTA
ncbi:MAG TPA: baseplate J/gp47 family protein, partial [Myxococcota bacterium]|nr:baseplate J/gp47 family protein [Myxococcota bacterium]